MAPKNANSGEAKISTCDPDKQAEVVQCDVCLTEVPVSVAKNVEGLDYVHYFCGLDCLQTWLDQANAKVGGNR